MSKALSITLTVVAVLLIVVLLAAGTTFIARMVVGHYMKETPQQTAQIIAQAMGKEISGLKGAVSTGTSFPVGGNSEPLMVSPGVSVPGGIEASGSAIVVVAGGDVYMGTEEPWYEEEVLPAPPEEPNTPAVKKPEAKKSATPAPPVSTPPPPPPAPVPPEPAPVSVAPSSYDGPAPASPSTTTMVVEKAVEVPSTTVLFVEQPPSPEMIVSMGMSRSALMSSVYWYEGSYFGYDSGYCGYRAITDGTMIEAYGSYWRGGGCVGRHYNSGGMIDYGCYDTYRYEHNTYQPININVSVDVDGGRRGRGGTDGRIVHVGGGGREVSRPSGTPITRPQGTPISRPTGTPVTRPSGKPISQSTERTPVVRTGTPVRTPAPQSGRAIASERGTSVRTPTCSGGRGGESIRQSSSGGRSISKSPSVVRTPSRVSSSPSGRAIASERGTSVRTPTCSGGRGGLSLRQSSSNGGGRSIMKTSAPSRQPQPQRMAQPTRSQRSQPVARPASMRQGESPRNRR